MKKSYVIILVVVLIIIAVALWWFLKGKPAGVPGGEAGPITEPTGLGAQIYEQVSQNPVEGNIPEVNPFKAEINPFKEAYKNPFGQ